MIGKKLPLFCWDSCVYLTYLNPNSPRESENKKHLPDIIELIRRSELNEIRLATSQITMVEVTSCMEDENLEGRFQMVFNGQYHVRYDVDPKITQQARLLRAELLKQKPKIKIAVPDALHIATAMILGAEEFHTFDDGKMDGDKCSLLSLDGNPLLRGLRIKKPNAPQTDLPSLLLAAPMPKVKQARLIESVE